MPREAGQCCLISTCLCIVYGIPILVISNTVKLVI